MAWYRCRHKGSGGVTPVGDATDSDVLNGKTYMNASGASTGIMPNRGAVSATLDTSTTSYTVPEGYHNGSGTVSISTETKTITAGTSASTTSATSGKVISSVTVNPTPSQTKSATPSTSAQTISPDSGKLLSSVSVAAMSPIHTGGTAWVTLSGINATAPWVYIPGGWYPQENATYGTYVYMTTAQAQQLHAHTGTYTFPANDTGGTKDLGEKHSYRYVNAANVYTKGKADGKASGSSRTLVGSYSGNQTINISSYKDTTLAHYAVIPTACSARINKHGDNDVHFDRTVTINPSYSISGSNLVVTGCYIDSYHSGGGGNNLYITLSYQVYHYGG